MLRMINECQYSIPKKPKNLKNVYNHKNIAYFGILYTYSKMKTLSSSIRTKYLGNLKYIRSAEKNE